ncbi:MAG: tetratricopeptide repeat protein [Deltaproteobacteria bacterium]|nr:tetratricopeptide repeat protein [Deltaproteobacteria bacterium]
MNTKTVIRIVFALALPLALLGLSAVASAASPKARARQHFLAGKGHYASGRYQAAVHAFQRAGRILPSPLLDFNIARCYEGLQRSKDAILHYKRYLRRRPKAKNRGVVEARIAALKRLLKSTKDPYEDLEQAPADGDHQGVVVAPTAAPTAAVQPPNASFASTEPAAPGAGPASRPEATSLPLPLPPRRPSGWKDAEPEGAKAAVVPRSAPARDPWRGPQEKALYRQGWFWAAVGVGALITTFIIITTFTSTAEDGPQPASSGLSIAF